jgi:sn-glycerol 3-phosphate transport system substrate-binding protein
MGGVFFHLFNTLFMPHNIVKNYKEVTMKRSYLVLSWIMILLLVSAFAWARGEQEAQGPKILTLWYPEGQITAGAAHFSSPGLFAEFEAENNCVVKLVGGDYDTLLQKVFTSMAAGVAPDIIFIDKSWAPGFLKEDALAPVPQADAKAWLDGVMPEIKILSDYGNGKMWGYPQYGIDVYGITWNKDYFRKAGLDPSVAPADWKEFREYAKRLTEYDNSGNITRVGYAIRHLGQPHGIVHKHLWALWGAGAALISDPLALKGGNTGFNNQAGRDALMLIHDMLYTDKSTALDMPDPRTALLQGLSAMQISETISIKARQPKEAPDLDWGVALPPVKERGMTPVTNLNSWFYSVPASSQNKELAWKAIKWLNSEKKDFELCSQFKSTPRYKANWAKAPFTTDAYSQSLRKMLPYGKAYPNNLALNSIMEALGTAIQKTWHKEASVAKALEEAQKKADAAIAAIN